MGCCSSHGSIKATVPKVASKPSIFLEENFKLLDYTHATRDVKDFFNVKDFFANYKLTDVRCVKRLNENEEVHSSVIVISSRVKVERTLEEICLLVQYSPYGFALFLGETNEVLTSCNIRENSSEMIHFPGADSHAEGGMVKVLEWAHAHKDEKYCDPAENSELNMGHRLFNFVMSLFNSKKNVI